MKAGGYIKCYFAVQIRWESVVLCISFFVSKSVNNVNSYEATYCTPRRGREIARCEERARKTSIKLCMGEGARWMVARTGRMIAFYVKIFSGSWQENLQNDGLRAIVKRHGGRGSCFGGTVIHEQGRHLLRIRLRRSAGEPSGCEVGVRSRCLLQRSRRHGCDRKRRALATGEHRGEGQTGVRYVNIGARLAPRCWHTHVDGSQDHDTSCPLHSARALTQCVLSCLFYWYSDSESWLDKYLNCHKSIIQK